MAIIVSILLGGMLFVAFVVAGVASLFSLPFWPVFGIVFVIECFVGALITFGQ